MSEIFHSAALAHHTREDTVAQVRSEIILTLRLKAN